MAQTSGVGFSPSELSSGLSKERLDEIAKKVLVRETQNIERVENQQKKIQEKIDLYTQFGGLLNKLSIASGLLNQQGTFSSVQGSSSNELSTTITTNPSSLPGEYTLNLTQVAQTQKIASAAQNDPITALNISGTMVINGQAIEISGTDNLTQIALKINSNQLSGVNANVINGGTGKTYLTLSPKQTGTLPGPLETSLQQVIQISDVVGNVSSSLGLVTGGLSVRNTPTSATNSVLSSTFSSSTSSLSSIMGSDNLPSGNITINGVNIAVDMNNHSLQDIVNGINNKNNVHATATLVQTISYPGGIVSPLNAVKSYALQIINDNTGSAPTLDDPNNILSGLGVLQASYGNQLAQAKNATYTLDGIELTSASNTVENVIPGATMKFIAPNDQNNPVTLSLTSSDSSMVQAAQEFQSSYNAVMDFIRKNGSYDRDTNTSQPLFHDFTTTQIQQQVAQMVFNSPPNLTGTYQNLTQIGFSFDKSGNLNLDTNALKSAIATDSKGVSDLFMATGSGSTNQLNYISANEHTKSSGINGYAVNITQPATLGSFLAETSQKKVNPSNETLTFGGNLFGPSGYQLVLNPNNDLSKTIDQINTDANLKDLVVATEEKGTLKVESKIYGSDGNFTLVSSLAAAKDNSGVGTSGTITAGLNVAGTINGESATGYGQFLYGNDGNLNTSGLGIVYSGNSSGIVGQVFFTNGVGASMQNLIESFTGNYNGFLTSRKSALQTDYSNLSKRMDTLKNIMNTKEQEVRNKLAGAERIRTIARIQLDRMNSMLDGLMPSKR